MNSLIFIALILMSNYLLVKISKKLGVINIVSQLLMAMLFAPLLMIKFPEFNIFNIAKSEIVKEIYNFAFVFLMTYILHDNVDCKYQKKDIKLVLPSFFIPFLSGAIFSYYWLNEFHLNSAIVFGIIFSITAVPVLYLYLKDMKYNDEEIKFFMQSAIMIDIISWLLHSIFSEFKIDIIYFIIIAAITALIIFKVNKKLSGLGLFILLLITSYFKGNILLVGVIYVLTSSYLKMEINLLLKAEKLEKANTNLFIPILLFIGLCKVNWSEIQIQLDFKTILLIIIPIVSKMLGNYIGLLLLNKENKFISSILLNTRGLTEIVFLNLVFRLNYIDSYTYVIFLFMSLISTIFPGFLSILKYNKKEKLVTV